MKTLSQKQRYERNTVAGEIEIAISSRRVRVEVIGSSGQVQPRADKHRSWKEGSALYVM